MRPSSEDQQDVNQDDDEFWQDLVTTSIKNERKGHQPLWIGRQHQ